VHLSRQEGSHERGLQQSEHARSKPGTSESRPSLSQNVGINKAVYVGTTLPCESHTTPHVHALLAAAGPMLWRANPRQEVGDDVAPTSLNGGGGEVVMKALVVACYLGQKHCPVGLVVDQWWRKGKWAAQMWKGGNVPFLERTQMGFPMRNAKSRSSVVPRTSHAGETRRYVYLM
jgi:hypothetical protein